MFAMIYDEPPALSEGKKQRTESDFLALNKIFFFYLQHQFVSKMSSSLVHIIMCILIPLVAFRGKRL